MTSRSLYIPVRSGELYAEVSGSGPVLVLCHAGIANLRMWDPQIEVLSHRFQVIAYDARGYGRSRSEKGEFSPVDDLRAVADFSSSPAVGLMGCSMGGLLALEYAAATPDRVWGLVWVCGGLLGLRWDRDKAERELEARRALLVEAQDCDALAQLDSHLWVDGPRSPEGRAPASVRAQVRDMILINCQRDDDGLQLEFDDEPDPKRLGRITCPALLIIGDLDASLVQTAAQILLRELPDAQEIRFADAAHVPNMEHPGAFNDAVMPFLERAGHRASATSSVTG